MMLVMWVPGVAVTSVVRTSIRLGIAMVSELAVRLTVSLTVLTPVRTLLVSDLVPFLALSWVLVCVRLWVLIRTFLIPEDVTDLACSRSCVSGVNVGWVWVPSWRMVALVLEIIFIRPVESGLLKVDSLLGTNDLHR